MTFARKVWKLLVAIKDGLVLVLLLLFFAALYGILSMRPAPHSVEEGALLVKLDGVVVEEPQAVDPLALLAARGLPTREHSARDVIRAIRGAASDDKIKAVVLDLDFFLGAGQAHLSEIGEAIDIVRAADKPVLAHAIAYTGDTMQLASHASEVWVDPLGGALIAGPGGTILFYGDLMDRLDVNIHVYRAGRYKSAVEPWTSASFSDDARSDITGVYDTLWEIWKGEVGKGRPKADIARLASDPVAAIEAAGGDSAKAAQASGLVDRIGTREEFAERVAEIAGKDDSAPENPGAYAHTGYAIWNAANPISDAGKPIGVITVAGDVVDGTAGPGTAGGDRIAKLLDDALDDDLAALVIRIDSPGGSVTAVERMRQALLRHKDKGIPIVASMANMSASAGYYVAMPADTVFADPSTITGSIGVYLVTPSFENTISRIGLSTDSVRTTPLTGQPSVLGGFSPELEQIMQSQTDKAYDRFLTIVGKSRKKDRAELLTLAEGRTWTGGGARQVGLVDRFGGLDDALAYAAKEAGLGDGEWHAAYLAEEPSAFARFVQGMSRPKEDARSVGLVQLAAAQRNAVLGAFFEDSQTMLANPGITARCIACPAPARLLQRDLDAGGWLAALELLGAR